MPAAERRSGIEQQEARIAWALVLPALLTILLVALFPLVWTAVGVAPPARSPDALAGPAVRGSRQLRRGVRRSRGSGARSGTRAFFAVTSVALELIIGLWLALALNRAFRGRGLVRAAVLVPWAIPTVVSALLWRFMFEGQPAS